MGKLIDRFWKGEVDCASCEIRELVLFAHLDSEDFNEIHEPINDYYHIQGSCLYRQGDTGNFVFTIRSGAVKLELTSESGEKKITRILGRGDVAGLEAILHKEYHLTATFLEPGEVCQVPVSVIEALKIKKPILCNDLMLRWDQSLTQADHWMADLHVGHSRKRVIKLVQYLADNSGDSSHFLLPSRDDMSAILSISKETVSRIVADLKRDNVIKTMDNGYYCISK